MSEFFEEDPGEAFQRRLDAQQELRKCIFEATQIRNDADNFDTKFDEEITELLEGDK